MSDGARMDEFTLADYRDFLCNVARLHLDPRLQKKLDAEDVVQKTLLRAHEKRSDYHGDNPRQFKAWLRSILLTVLANSVRELRAAKRDDLRERSLDAALENSSHRLDALLAADQSSPSEQAVRNEQVLLLDEALALLPERQREAIVLKHYHNWSLSAISEHMGTSPSAVAGLLIRGLKQLRNQLED